ncbi:MAG TPA: serine/threonine-protein kinase [Polyangiaceae bacterium]|nr:serine/threonine-protein kinase [Polyangiaceae bacterium]
MAPDDALQPSLPLRRLGRYELRAKIADGGMAEVHVARRLDGPHAGEIVAIKTIREEFARNREFLTMFLDEAQLVARLRHPNVLRTYELGEAGGELFLAMELLFGQSLWSVWEACRARRVRLRYPMIAWIGARAAEGLHYAHELRDEHGAPLEIIHRDVNATNLFVTYEGAVKVIDFGLAKAANRASKTAAGVIKGKVAYMSPEQAVGATIDRRTDVFALGTTLWELACDRRLFKRSDDVDTLRRVHAAEVPDPTCLVDGFPPALWSVLQRALARDPSERYATAADLARDLDALFPGARADAASVAAVMRQLFGEDHRRQMAWVAEVSGPEHPRASATGSMKARSTFWTSNDPLATVPPPRPLAPSTPGGAFPSPRAPPPSRRRPDARSLIAVAIGTAVVIAVLVVGVLAYR